MPIFEYHCSQCNREFEKLVFAADNAPVTCPDCKSTRVTKKMSAASLKSASKCAPAGSAGGGKPFS